MCACVVKYKIRHWDDTQQFGIIVASGQGEVGEEEIGWDGDGGVVTFENSPSLPAMFPSLSASHPSSPPPSVSPFLLSPPSPPSLSALPLPIFLSFFF